MKTILGKMSVTLKLRVFAPCTRQEFEQSFVPQSRQFTHSNKSANTNCWRMIKQQAALQRLYWRDTNLITSISTCHMFVAILFEA